ncbi:MAG: transposase [Acidimicrobiia bacterium]|nr:transposase [Acidimicrobiia bacterium]
MDICRKVDTMSRISKHRTSRRPRRQFTDESKAGAIRLVLDEGKTVGAVARELDLTPSALAVWVRRAQADARVGHGWQSGSKLRQNGDGRISVSRRVSDETSTACRGCGDADGGDGDGVGADHPQRTRGRHHSSAGISWRCCVSTQSRSNVF